ncbi:MAG: AMP-binding protein [Burkholderiales bacterium]|nr:AMP-binding protein [Burkholderiales bacterium]
MEPRHFRHWPPNLPGSLAPARETLWQALERTARRFPDKPATIYRGETRTWSEVERRAIALAGHLRKACGVRRGDRVAALHAEQRRLDRRLPRDPARRCGGGAACADEPSARARPLRRRAARRKPRSSSRRPRSASPACRSSTSSSWARRRSGPPTRASRGLLPATSA